MKILICGSDGQLGSDCTNVLKPAYEVLPVDLEDLDITNPTDVETMVQEFMPDIILNCAAYTSVDDCETKKGLARSVNVQGPRNLGITAKKHGAQLIHISTDYVFGGKKKVPEPYSEEDDPSPLSYYGRTKFEGEEAIRKTIDSHIIVRTAWLYGLQGHNFLKTMLKLTLKDPHKEIKVVNDQFGSPTWSYRLALQIKELIEVRGHGTYHATSDGFCTWHELASCFLEKMGVPHSLIPCTTEEYPTPAIRPMNSILENRRLKGAGIDIMPHWEDDLDQFVSTCRERLINEVKHERTSIPSG
ncbi:MAG TPA: dTDP-4-dehydrorhamnose reductase [Desulfatiglandales bacterium]|nr:dTDP-4-dehydrorhamnose reductase [Desulfatiglandales bacterium]